MVIAVPDNLNQRKFQCKQQRSRIQFVDSSSRKQIDSDLDEKNAAGCSA